MATWTRHQYFCTADDTILYVSSSVSSVSNKVQAYVLSNILGEIFQISSGKFVAEFRLVVYPSEHSVGMF